MKYYTTSSSYTKCTVRQRNIQANYQVRNFEKKNPPKPNQDTSQPRSGQRSKRSILVKNFASVSERGHEDSAGSLGNGWSSSGHFQFVTVSRVRTPSLFSFHVVPFTGSLASTLSPSRATCSSNRFALVYQTTRDSYPSVHRLLHVQLWKKSLIPPFLSSISPRPRSASPFRLTDHLPRLDRSLLYEL